MARTKRTPTHVQLAMIPAATAKSSTAVFPYASRQVVVSPMISNGGGKSPALREKPIRVTNKLMEMVTTTTTGRPRGPQCGQEGLRVPLLSVVSVAMREICRYQKSTDCLIHKLPFSHSVREITKNLDSRPRLTILPNKRRYSIESGSSFSYTLFKLD